METRSGEGAWYPKRRVGKLELVLAAAVVFAWAGLSACGGGGGATGNGSSPGDAGQDTAQGDGPVSPGDSSTGGDSSFVSDSATGPKPDGQSSSSGGDSGVVTGDGGAGYGGDGPVAYTMTTASVANGSDTFTVNLWIPGSAGPHPVVSFSPGLQQVSAPYFGYATRLASWGFVVLMRDDAGLLVSGDTIAADLSYTVGTWLPTQNTTSGSPLFGKVDVSHVGLAGHSRGGQTTLYAAETGLHGKVQAWVGLDPVNTAYSAGTAPSTNLPSIGIPTTYIGAGVMTNCAPSGDDYLSLYAVSPSPSIAITVANASHSQFEDLSVCSLCNVCTPVGTANPPTVLALAKKYLTAFFARELLGDASVGTLFQGAGAAADEASGAISIVSK
jgi:hypothetical protein